MADLVTNHFVLKVKRRTSPTGGKVHRWYDERLQDVTGDEIL